MNLNVTLLVQAAVLIILGWGTMKFIWPPLIRAIDDRQKKIAAGLADAERGHKELEQSHATAANGIFRSSKRVSGNLSAMNFPSGAFDKIPRGE